MKKHDNNDMPADRPDKIRVFYSEKSDTLYTLDPEGRASFVASDGHEGKTELTALGDPHLTLRWLKKHPTMYDPAVFIGEL